MRISDWSSDVCSSDLLSLGRFRHLFTAEIGMPFQRYVLWRRLLIAFDAIGGQHSATEAAHMAGFSDSARFARTRSEEHTSELQSLMRISYAVFCLKKKRTNRPSTTTSYNAQTATNV